VAIVGEDKRPKVGASWVKPKARPSRMGDIHPTADHLNAPLRPHDDGGMDRPGVPASSVPGKAFPLGRVNDSDLCAVCTVGTNLTARMVTVWHRGKSGVNCLLGKAYKPTCPFPLPYEIVEMIIAHLTRDLRTLKACSLICWGSRSGTCEVSQFPYTVESQVFQDGGLHIVPRQTLCYTSELCRIWGNDAEGS